MCSANLLYTYWVPLMGLTGGIRPTASMDCKVEGASHAWELPLTHVLWGVMI